MTADLIKSILKVDFEEVFAGEVLETVDEKSCRMDGSFQTAFNSYLQLAMRWEKLEEIGFDVEAT